MESAEKTPEQEGSGRRRVGSRGLGRGAVRPVTRPGPSGATGRIVRNGVTDTSRCRPVALSVLTDTCRSTSALLHSESHFQCLCRSDLGPHGHLTRRAPGLSVGVPSITAPVSRRPAVVPCVRCLPRPAGGSTGTSTGRRTPGRVPGQGTGVPGLEAPWADRRESRSCPSRTGTESPRVLRASGAHELSAALERSVRAVDSCHALCAGLRQTHPTAGSPPL